MEVKIKTSINKERGIKPKYEQIWSIQQAINIAKNENRIVRFKTKMSNKKIKQSISNLHGCLIRKPKKNSCEVAIIPPGIEDFCFDTAVDTKIKTKIAIK